MVKKIIIELFVRVWTGYSMVGGVAIGLLAYFLCFSLLYPIAFILLINFFDLVGYGKIMATNETHSIDLYYETLPYYRILQKSFSIILALSIYGLTDSWILSLLCYMSNFGGMQDVLYYLFGRYNFNQNYTWLKWSPYGFLIWKIYNRGLNKYEFIAQGIISFTFIILLVTIWKA